MKIDVVIFCLKIYLLEIFLLRINLYLGSVFNFISSFLLFLYFSNIYFDKSIERLSHR